RHRPPPSVAPLPYTTLFRSVVAAAAADDEGVDAGFRRARWRLGLKRDCHRHEREDQPHLLSVDHVILRCGQSMTGRAAGCGYPRSEEHTSELQSRDNLVCRL